ncbi:MAG: SDR family oxidoreductase [Dehalobacterium sp.]
MTRLQDKVAIITGGTFGIGEATVKMFVKEGAKVVFVGRNQEKGLELEQQINSTGRKSAFFQMDVSDVSKWPEVIDFTIKTYGKLNILVNNAGISDKLNVENCDLASWDKTIAVNQSSLFYGMKYAIGAMKNNGEMCSIVNVASAFSMVADGEYFPYCASKAAVQNMTKSAAIHCGESKYKIRVNSVHPGCVITPMAYEDAKQWGLTMEEYVKGYLAIHPIGYLGEPDDIAYGILYLASDESKFVTASHLVIDGGSIAK